MWTSHAELKKTIVDYKKKLKANALCWDIKELESISETGRQLYIELQTFGDRLPNTSASMKQINTAKELTGIKESALSLVKRIYRHNYENCCHTCPCDYD